jgi:hypothetical protein
LGHFWFQIEKRGKRREVNLKPCCGNPKKEAAGWGAFHRRFLDSVVPAA